MSIFIGIDLGTTYSCIAKCDDHNMASPIRCQKTTIGHATPSVVFYDDDGTPIVGDDAKERSCVEGDAERTLSFIKRSMGQDYCPDPIIFGPDTKRQVSPVEGSACILHALFQAAIDEETSRGNNAPTKAVITIPAGYTAKQRSCTKKAAELAGIEVVGLIHEPTAAAVSHDIKSGETVLVFDLGGGTLDVSIVRYNEGQYKILGVASDSDILHHNLGGKDWDEILMKLACQKQQIDVSKCSRSQKGYLLFNAEVCKKRLTGSQTAKFIFHDNSNVLITRNEFVNNTKSLVAECIKVVEACIEKAGKDVDINRFIMVGGSSNMPMLRNALSKKFGPRFGKGRDDKNWIIVSNSAETSISEGAAKYAFQLEKDPNKGVLFIEEMSSHSYGTSCTIDRGETREERICNLIKATDPMVFESREFPFSTNNENQKAVTVDIFETNSNEETIPMDKSSKPIYCQTYKFGKSVQKGTDVTFTVSRDKDGLIKIQVSSPGCTTKEFEYSTMQPPVTPEIEKQIRKSIQLMDIADSIDKQL